MKKTIVRVGMQTPWGKADYAETIASGIGIVGTPSHGGIKVDRKHNQLIPDYMRRTGGWYEEDCDWAIPFCVLANEIYNRGNCDKYIFKYITENNHKESLKSWNAASYNKYYGQNVEDKHKITEDAQAEAEADGLPVIKAGVGLPNDNVFVWTSQGNYEVKKDVYHKSLQGINHVLETTNAVIRQDESPVEVYG